MTEESGQNLDRMRRGKWLIAYVNKESSSYVFTRRHGVLSSLVSLACDCGCTVGPGAVGCPAGGGGMEDPLDADGGGTRVGY